MDSGKVQSNPAWTVRRRLENNERVRFLSVAEEAKLRAVIREHWPEREPELDIALQTGLRRGGMYKIQWRDVDFEYRLLAERYGKRGKTRYVRLNQLALDAFLKLRRTSKGEGRVFDIQNPRHWFEKAVARAGISDFRWHDLRHTFGSRLAMMGAPLEAIRKLMGHRSIIVTTRYAHLAPVFEEEAIDRLLSFGREDEKGDAPAKRQNGTDAKTDSRKSAIQ